ncbi:MAG: flagellar motor protein MotA [Caenispirillum bisanense]|nr:flagellar motor protein MotA [Caenispirillum bisanense]MCA1973551.1 flagellar motor protein MotA [Caenispirillum sp.]
MIRPRRYLVRIGVFLAAVLVVAGLLFAPLLDAFMANPALNGLILGVLLIGVGLNIRQVAMLGPEADWIDDFRQNRTAVASGEAPRLLAPMATMLGQGPRDRQGRFSLSAPAMRSLLDGIASRLDESREISRYFIGLSIFLGLLGTFWGLMQTITAVGDVIGQLSIGGASDMQAVFDNLKQGLEQPLQGMGTSFSSSLFGLGGSLVLGFVDLQAGQAQNAFFNDLEDWLSGVTKVSSGGGGIETDTSVPVYIQALLEQTAESLQELQYTVSRTEEARTGANSQLRDLTDRLTTLTDQMRTEQTLLLRMAESQQELRPLLQRLAEAAATGGFGMDDASRSHLRNVDVALQRVVDELARGREYTVKEVRSEIKLLARTIAALAEEPDHRQS